jgi:glycosyltransferase involved in cell wall biosynthesis
MKRHLLIVLRTCTIINSASGTSRYIKVPKRELVQRCVSSLVNSINQVLDYDIELVVLDDHSTPEAVIDIKNIISHCKFPTELISVTDGQGNGWTIGKVYDMVEERCRDLWYHVEDDYLHVPEAINDMIASVDQFEVNTGRMVAINPHDDIWRYVQEIYESILLLGPYRHYRTVRHTTGTCLASKQIYNKYKKHFRDIVHMLINKEDWVENKSINLVWQKDDVMLFSPIPGVGFHIMDPSGKDPYIDIEAVWDSVPQLWKSNDTPNFAVVSMYNDEHRDLAKYTWPNKEKYAKKHGYKAFAKTSNWTITPVHFEKITHMLDVMKQYPDIDWVWWLDNDAVITNPDIKLENIIDPDYHVIITTDIASINAGSFIVRNSIQGRGWLEFLLVKGLEHYKTNRWPEQQPMTDFYISFADIIKVVPQRIMNSYEYKIYNVDPNDLLGTSGQWQPGDFVLHMPAIPNVMRIQLIQQITQETLK